MPQITSPNLHLVLLINLWAIRLRRVCQHPSWHYMANKLNFPQSRLGLYAIMCTMVKPWFSGWKTRSSRTWFDSTPIALLAVSSRWVLPIHPDTQVTERYLLDCLSLRFLAFSPFPAINSNPVISVYLPSTSGLNDRLWCEARAP